MKGNVFDNYVTRGPRYSGDNLIGIEIEMEGLRNTGDLRIPDSWHVTVDGSLRGAGAVEFVTNGPIQYKNTKQELDKLRESLIKHISPKGNISGRTGVHVHLNVQDYDNNKLFTLIGMYLILEDLLVEWCGEDRICNIFCLRLQDADAILPNLIEAKIYDDLRHIGEGYKYAALNIGALFRYGTLEFRALPTPENFDRIEEWINIIYTLKEKAKNYGDIREIVEYISMVGGAEFVKEVLGRGFGSAARLDKKIMESCRLVQDLAYAKRKTSEKKTSKPIRTRPAQIRRRRR